MNSRRKWTVGIIVALVLINMATLGSFWFMRRPPHPPQLDKFFEKELNLTPEQVAKFKALQDAHNDKGHKLHDSMRLYKDAFFDEMLSDNPRQTILDSMNISMSRLSIALDNNLVQQYRELQAICTSKEQKEKLREIFKKSIKRSSGPPPKK